MMYTEIVAKFKALYKHEPVLLRAPGKVNLTGDQTSYRNSLAGAAATSKEILFAIAPNGLPLCRVHAFNEKQSDAFVLKQRMSRSSRSWENHVKEVVARFMKAGYQLEGFDLVYGTNAPVGARLSSAAIECGLVLALHHIFDFNVEQYELARIEKKTGHAFACKIL